MNTQSKQDHLTDQQIDEALDTALAGEILNTSPESATGSGDASKAVVIPRAATMEPLAAAAGDDPVFVGTEATRLKRNSAEGQLRDHIAQLGRFDRFIVGMAMRGAHRKAALQLTDALVKVSLETAHFKIGMASQIVRAELLIEFLRTQPRLAAEVSRLCHETRVVLSDQLFHLSDEIYGMRNKRLAEIDEKERGGFFTREDAEEQREALRQIVAEELIDKQARYSATFKNISRNFVRTLTTALEHVQSAPPTLAHT